MTPYIIGSKTNNQSAQGELNLIYVIANNADIIGAESTFGDVKGTITLSGNNVLLLKMSMAVKQEAVMQTKTL